MLAIVNYLLNLTMSTNPSTHSIHSTRNQDLISKNRRLLEEMSQILTKHTVRIT